MDNEEVDDEQMEEIEMDDDNTDDSMDGIGMIEAAVPTTPIVEAILDGEPLDVIEDILLRSPELMQQRVMGKYPLIHAVQHGSPVEIVKALYECSPESSRTKDNCDCLPLHFVCGTDPNEGTGETPVETVEFLVDVYPEAIHHPDFLGFLPIHKSIQNGATAAAVRVLAERCPESLLVSADGCLPIHYAVIPGIGFLTNFELAEYLADRCPESLRVMAGDEKEDDEIDDVHFLPIHTAAQGTRQPDPNQMPILQLLFNRYPESLGVATTDKDKDLPIHFAARGGGVQQLEVIDFFLGHRPDTLLASNAHGLLPVHTALQSWERVSAGVIERLSAEPVPEATRLGLLHFAVRDALERLNLEHPYFPTRRLRNVSALVQALPETVRATDSEGSLPIHVAVHLTSHIHSSRLIDRIVSISGRTPIDLVRRLVALAPDTLLIKNSAAELPLHIAMNQDRRLDMKMAKLLFKRSPQSALVATRDGNLPIHIAIANRDFRLVKCIVKHGPDGSQGRGARGRTPMHIVATLQCSTSEVDSQQLLYAAHALVRSWPESLLIRDADDKLAIDVAVECLTDGWACEFARFLIEHSPDSLREAGASGMLPLHVAVSQTNPSPNLVQLLVSSWTGALEVREMSGQLPLQLGQANPTASLDLIYILVRAKPDLLRSLLS